MSATRRYSLTIRRSLKASNRQLHDWKSSLTFSEPAFFIFNRRDTPDAITFVAFSDRETKSRR
jgi:hypothetical protein